MKNFAITISVICVAVACASVIHAEDANSLGTSDTREVYTRYDGEEYFAVTDFGGFHHFEYRFDRGLSYPAKWTYQYVDSAKRIGTYQFDGEEGVLYYYGLVTIRPVRMLSYTPSSSLKNTPFFNGKFTQFQCKWEDIVETTVTNYAYSQLTVGTAHLKCSFMLPTGPAHSFDYGYIQKRQGSGGGGSDWIDTGFGQFSAEHGTEGDIVWANLQYPFIKYVGPYCFASNSVLTSVVVPEGVTHIEEGAFSGCKNLTSVTLPSTLEFIGENAFDGCDSLTAFITDDGNANFKSVDGALFTKDGKRLLAFPRGKGGTYTLPSDVETIDDHAFEGCTNVVVEIPWENSLEGLGRTSGISVPDYTFEIWGPDNPLNDCTQVRMAVPEGVESVSRWKNPALVYCTHVLLPSTWKATPSEWDGLNGSYQFCDCYDLVSIEVSTENPDYRSIDGVVYSIDGKTLSAFPIGRRGIFAVPAGVTSIGRHAFHECLLGGVIFPDSLLEINFYAFGYCRNLTNVQFSASVKNIGDFSFFDSGLESLTIPSSVETIGEGAFCGCFHLEGVVVDVQNEAYCSTNGILCSKDCAELLCYPGGRHGAYEIPEHFRKIHRYAFSGIGLTSVVIPNTVEIIMGSAFRSCENLVSASLPDNLTSIPEEMFTYCWKLEYINLPDSLKSIGRWAFGDCDSLDAVVIPDSISLVGDMVFDDCDSLVSISVPYALKTVVEDWGLPDTCDITIRDPSSLCIEPELPHAMEGIAYSVQLEALCGTSPYVWAMDEVEYPDGEISEDGALTVWTDQFELNGYSRTLRFPIIVTDHNDHTITQTVYVVMDPNPNRRPEIDSQSPWDDGIEWDGVIRVGEAQTFSVVAHDPEGEPLTFFWRLDDEPIDCPTDSWTWTPPREDIGKHSLSVLCSDGERESWSWSWNFKVVTTNVLSVTTTLPAAIVGQPYEASLSVTGGTEPYSWAFQQYGTNRTASTFTETGVAQDWSGDDGCWRVELPFAFQFYGSTYDEIWVSDNGTICLDGEFSKWNFSEDDFMSHAMIAPLWCDLDGDLQTIYYDSSVSGQITIRWKGRIYDCDESAPDVAFSATLCADGTIRFAYSDTCGTGGLGVSNGDGRLFLRPSAVQNTDMSGADDIVFAPSPFAPGLDMTSCGVVSGTPTDAGTYHIPVAVTDSEGATWSGEVSLVVLPSADATIPELAEETPESVTNAIASAGFAPSVAARLQDAISGDAAKYNEFRAWAQTVKGNDGETAGEAAVIASERAAISYLFGTDTLIAVDIESEDVHITKFSTAHGAKSEDGKKQFSFDVAIDGVEIGSSSAIGLASLKENLKKAIGIKGATKLDGTFSSNSIELTFDTPVDGKARFTATPPPDAETSFFMRAEVK